MNALLVALTLVREVLRTLLTPLRLLLYLPRRHHWRRLAEAALADSVRDEGPCDREVVLQRLVDRAQRSARPRAPGERARLFVSAGEASGEAHAARLEIGRAHV